MQKITATTLGPLLLAVLLTAVFAACTESTGQESRASDTNRIMTTAQLEGNVHAPEFPDNLEWLNTEVPLTLGQFRGKVVLLDFWTFCCINCIHVIPDLKKLEVKYADELVVIGVHSAKFTNEKSTETIRQAILRYEINHPVVNDAYFEVWEAYATRAWPTFVLINPNGRIVGVHSGEGVYDLFDAIIEETISHFDAKGELVRGPLITAPESDRQPNTLLSFPGKVKADSKTGRLYISDTNHNRIIVTDRTGTILDVIGAGTSGSADGSFETVEFNHPQGTFVKDNTLYVADTENHLIRAADLTNRTVRTLVGTGHQAREFDRIGYGPEAALNSPWDLVGIGKMLYVAMAGSHQIWSINLETLEAKPHAGSSRENRIDGPLLSAQLAQPSGITTDGTLLYFADSEVSSIRSAAIETDGQVATIIGRSLFQFGDVDGPVDAALLQHPLGVVYRNGLLFVADTYNSKIKVVNPSWRTSATYAGTGMHGLVDGPRGAAQFNEPSGVTVLGDELFVADANNHEIRIVNIETGEVSTLVLSNVERLSERGMAQLAGRVIEVPQRTILKGPGRIGINVVLPDGYHLLPGAPIHVELKSDNEKVMRAIGHTRTMSASGEPQPFQVTVQSRRGKTEVTLDALIYYCSDITKTCLIDKLQIKMPVEVKSRRAPDAIGLTVAVEVPEEPVGIQSEIFQAK